VTHAPPTTPSHPDDSDERSPAPPGPAPARVLFESCRRYVSRPVAVALLFGLATSLLAWRGTSPRWAIFLNWDAGVYLWDIARSGPRWVGGGWSSHFAMTQLYAVAAWVSLLFGGTAMEGFRLLNAGAFGLTATLLAHAAQRARLSHRLTALVVALWLFSYPTFLDLATVEDNAVFLPSAAALFWLASERIGPWGARESLAAGAFSALGMLVSWQAALYLAPSLYVALFLGRPARRMAQRFAHGAATVGGFLATLIAWVVFLAATSGTSFALLWHGFASRPNPSLFPTGLGGTLALFRNVGGMATTIGIAMYRMILPGFHLPSPRTLLLVGYATLTVLLAILFDSVRRLRARGGRQIHFLALILVLFTVLTGYYQIAEGDNIKRFDFVPLTVAFLAIAYWRATDGVGVKLGRRLVPVLILLLVCGEAAGASHWWRVTMSTPPTPRSNWVWGEHPAPAVVRGIQQSWYRRIAEAKQSKPGACRYVFDACEMEAGRWWAEISALLWSEMHDTHRVLADRAVQLRWTRPAHFAAVEEFVRDPSLLECSWFSETALARLKHAGVRPSGR
jgi:hypothetical protein